MPSVAFLFTSNYWISFYFRKNNRIGNGNKYKICRINYWMGLRHKTALNAYCGLTPNCSRVAFL